MKLVLITPIPKLIKKDLPSRLPDIEIVDCTEARERVIDEIVDADFAFGFVKPEEFRKAKKLRFIQHSGHGVDMFLYPEIVASNVLLANLKGICGAYMAEHAMALILAFSRGVHLSLRDQVEKRWRGRGIHTFSLEGKSLGCLGVGSIGTEVARLGKALGMVCRGCSRSGAENPQVGKVYSGTELEAFFRGSDFVVSTLPITPETRHFMNAEKFSWMKKTGVLINIGRGKTVDETALIEALQSGTIAGAGLDVFEEEPLSQTSTLWEMENVIVTGHVSAYGEEYRRKVADLLVENVRRVLKKETPYNLIDLKRGY